MFARISFRWTFSSWSGHARALALACWTAAVIMTGVMGWSAWRAIDEASHDVDSIVAHHEAGVVAKGRDPLIARR